MSRGVDCFEGSKQEVAEMMSEEVNDQTCRAAQTFLQTDVRGVRMQVF